MFNVTKETRGSSINPIPAPTELGVGERNPLYPHGFIFPTARLVNVVHEAEKEIKRREEVTKEPVLTFIFRDSKGRQATKTFFIIQNDDPAFNTLMGETQQMLKHFWDETIGEDKFPEKGLAPTAKDFKAFFKEVADSFNNVTREVPGGSDEKPKLVRVYAQTDIYIKQTYYQTNLQFPKFPNVIQKAIGGKGQLACELRINPKYDEVKPKVAAGGGNTGGGFVPDTSIHDTFPGGDGFPTLP